MFNCQENSIMIYPSTEGVLRKHAMRVIKLIERFTGNQTQIRDKQWHKAEYRGKAVLWFAFIGTRAKKSPPNSVLIKTYWADCFDGWTERKDDMRGGPFLACFSARAGCVKDMAKLKRFIRLAITHLKT
jgi:hypothetical protein